MRSEYEPSKNGATISITPGRLSGCEIDVPGDISPAAFFIVAALLGEDCAVIIRDVGLNPLRTGVLDIPRAMGGEIVGDIEARSSELRGIDIPTAWVSRAIDELPVVMVAASFAIGTTRLTGAAELRVKESDRISTMVEGLRGIGIEAEEVPDGAVIRGKDCAAGGTKIPTHFDHRIAMSFAIASVRCKAPWKSSSGKPC